MSNKTQDAVYNAKELGAGKVTVLGLQHMFAMFGASVLVPFISVIVENESPLNNTSLL